MIAAAAVEQPFRTASAEGPIDVTASVTRRYRLEQIQEAYDEMERGAIVGRAIIVMD